MATSGDSLLAINGDFLMAMDIVELRLPTPLPLLVELAAK